MRSNDGGISRLKKRLKAIPQDVREATVPSLMKNANAIANTMRQLAPDDPATDAPDLNSSIAVTGPGEQTPEYSQPGGAMTPACTTTHRTLLLLQTCWRASFLWVIDLPGFGHQGGFFRT